MADRYAVSTQTPGEAKMPELLQKKFDRNTKLAGERQTARDAKDKERQTQRTALRERTAKYNKEYDDTNKKNVDQRREAKKKGNFYVEPEPKLFFIIRIKGIMKLAPKPRKVLQLLRLRQINNGVFLKANRAILNMLKMVEPLVAFGYPSLRTVRELVYKRGFAKVTNKFNCGPQRIPLTNNDIISENLGQYGIHGIEDIVHEIYTSGPNFKQVSNFLWPFKLSNPSGGLVCKRHGYGQQIGGDWGNREEEINDLIRRMN